MTDQPFHFGLERVRELRVGAEDRAKEELAASMAARVRGASLLHEAEDRLSRSREAAVHASASAAVDGMALVAHQAWLERLERSAQELRRDLRRAEAEVEARRHALVDANRDRQVLERLKDRKRTEHRREQDRRIGAQLDELATSAFVRARLAGEAA